MAATSPSVGEPNTGVTVSTRSTLPRAYRAVRANGWKIVCRQAGLCDSAPIGAMTLTSCARQAHQHPTEHWGRFRLFGPAATRTLGTVPTVRAGGGPVLRNPRCWAIQIPADL